MNIIEAYTDKKNIPDATVESKLSYRKKIQLFCKENIESRVGEMDRNCKIDADLIHLLFENNLMNIEIPVVYGGLGKTFFDTVVTIEEVAKTDPSIAVFIDVQNSLINNAFLRWGKEFQQKKYLPLLAKSLAGSFSITEEEAGSDTYALSCKAIPADGGYILNGKKHWATNASEAGVFVIFAKITENNPNDSITAFIVDKQTEGLTVLPPQEKMGIRASSTCDIVLENVYVPEENILGGIGMGKRIALETLTDGRVGIAAQMLGLAQGALDLAIAYSQQRKQFGEHIGAFQGVYFELAKMATHIEAARQMIYHSVNLKSQGSNFMEYFKQACMAKYFASDISEKVASQAVEIFGGLGFMKSCPVEKFYRDAKIGRIYEGTTNIQLKTIARTLLKIKSLNK